MTLLIDALANLKIYNIKDELKGKVVLLLKNLAAASVENKTHLESTVLAHEEKEKLVAFLSWSAEDIKFNKRKELFSPDNNSLNVFELFLVLISVDYGVFNNISF